MNWLYNRPRLMFWMALLVIALGYAAVWAVKAWIFWSFS